MAGRGAPIAFANRRSTMWQLSGAMGNRQRGNLCGERSSVRFGLSAPVPLHCTESSGYENTASQSWNQAKARNWVRSMEERSEIQHEPQPSLGGRCAAADFDQPRSIGRNESLDLRCPSRTLAGPYAGPLLAAGHCVQRRFLESRRIRLDPIMLEDIATD